MSLISSSKLDRKPRSLLEATTAVAVAVSAVLESAAVSMGVAVATGCCSCNTLDLWTMRQFLRKTEHSRDIGGRAYAGASIICKRHQQAIKWIAIINKLLLNNTEWIETNSCTPVVSWMTDTSFLTRDTWSWACIAAKGVHGTLYMCDTDVLRFWPSPLPLVSASSNNSKCFRSPIIKRFDCTSRIDARKVLLVYLKSLQSYRNYIIKAEKVTLWVQLTYLKYQPLLLLQTLIF